MRKFCLLVILGGLFTTMLSAKTVVPSPPEANNHNVASVSNISKTFKIKGVVKDKNGEPLIGVNILLNQSKTGTITDINGEFSLEVKLGDVLEISYIGFNTIKIKITDDKPLKIVLKEDNKLLNGVVVTALGIKRQQKTLSYNVQEVKGDALTQVKDPNFVNSLDGQVAGVTINRSSTGVGGATRVVMRGVKSLEGNNNVLYVIDGVPLFNTSSGSDSGIKSGKKVSSEGIADFNPEDIASISVLSGPSAAALYGSSAANGVIMINTKRGIAGAAKVSISSMTEFSRPFVMPRFQNTYGNKPGSFESWGDKLDKPTTYDPAKDFFRTGVNVMNSATLTFGTEKNQTYISMGTTNANGIVPNNGYQRYNFNVNNNMKLLNNKLDVGVNFQYIKQKDMNMVSQGTYFNPIVSAYLFPRGENWDAIKVFERYDPSRKIPVQYWPLSEGVFGVQNPYWTAYRNLSENSKDRFILAGNLKYTFAKWINATTRFRMDKANNLFTRKLYASTNEIWSKPKGNYDFTKTQDDQYYGDFILNIDKRWNEFSLTANIGSSVSYFYQDITGYGGPLQLIPNMFTIGNINPTEGYPEEGGGGASLMNIGAFGSLELGYKSILFLTLTGRNDWNSRLVNSAEPSFFYPSIGASALLSEMFDMGNLVDLLKVRASYTQVGSPVSRSGLTPGTYTDIIKGGVLQASTIYPFGEFKAERTKSYEFGLNFKGFHGLSFDFTYYKSNTYNQTFLGTMPESSGYTKAYLQAGNVQNSGVEINLGYSHEWNDLALSNNIVYSHNKNVIKEMVRNYKHPLLNTTFNINEVKKGSTILKVGGSVNDIYSNSFLRQDEHGYVYIPESGELVMENRAKPVFLGRVTPDFNLGWNTKLSYKGLSLGIVLSGRFGGIVTSSTQAVLDRFGVSEASAIARDKGGFLIPNQGRVDAKSYYALTGASGDDNILGYYVYDATNIRVKQFTLSYKIPGKVFMNKIKSMTLSLIANNLWMIYCKAPFDPEITPSTGTYGIGNDYFMPPSTRNLGLSVKLNF